MRDVLPLLELTDFPAIYRKKIETLQVNLGYKCNQRCLHCHVNAGPHRKEMMDRATIELIVPTLKSHGIKTLDLTGGAPEIHEDFRYLVAEARAAGVHVIDRCNLTILFEPGHEDLAEFLAENQVEVVASLPCYSLENVDKQRGDGVFDKSIAGLKRLNSLGYSRADSDLRLNLVFNPQGPSLPPDEQGLENDFKRELLAHFGITFDHLYALANMPIKRFGSTLISKGQFHSYLKLLKDNFKQENLDQVMCRSLLSVDWQGYLYDCDFNQQLALPLAGGKRQHLSDLLDNNLEGIAIGVADHCFGCTAGQGSSCGGAL
ncbi:arsenosugar biosynthesis radical SAM (seleno)protein ArsS [Zhongshania borealis]|uniref:Arsenosugar biosynthesis radical SAM protein ArsS n=1 Tax=Zhongshania borealis TaxID=889488 RepID=A0ABP7WWW2_9GAMM